MNDRIVEIALRIALIKEEFEEADILDAVKLLEEYGTASALLAYLCGREVRPGTFPQRETRRKSKPIEEQRSKAVIDLQQRDPEKYRVLSEFDVLMRKGAILPELDDIKRVGERISKEFAPRKSRREAISALMTLVAQQPLDEIREIVALALSSARSDDRSDEYQELARFIIRGRPSERSRE